MAVQVPSWRAEGWGRRAVPDPQWPPFPPGQEGSQLAPTSPAHRLGAAASLCSSAPSSGSGRAPPSPKLSFHAIPLPARRLPVLPQRPEVLHLRPGPGPFPAELRGPLLGRLLVPKLPLRQPQRLLPGGLPSLLCQRHQLGPVEGLLLLPQAHRDENTAGLRPRPGPKAALLAAGLRECSPAGPRPPSTPSLSALLVNSSSPSSPCHTRHPRSQAYSLHPRRSCQPVPRPPLPPLNPQPRAAGPGGRLVLPLASLLPTCMAAITTP